MSVASEQPDRIGLYQFEKILADGGMADVWSGHLLTGDGVRIRPVAIKRIHPHLARSEDFLMKFAYEAKLGMRLRHPHIVEIIDYVDRVERPFLVMEYIDGPTLADIFSWCRTHQLEIPLRTCLTIAAQLLDGLEFAHSAIDIESGAPLEVIHRDLKPSNILISRRGIVKIADFGIARAADRPFETCTGAIQGTPGYMSPEQLAGKKGQSIAVDLWAVGVILYELVSQVRLFDGPFPKIVNDIHLGAFRDSLAHSERIPPDLRPILLRLLAHEPQQRYPSCKHLKQDLSLLQLALGPDCGNFTATVEATLFWTTNLQKSKQSRRKVLATPRIEPLLDNHPTELHRATELQHQNVAAPAPDRTSAEHDQDAATMQVPKAPVRMAVLPNHPVLPEAIRAPNSAPTAERAPFPHLLPGGFTQLRHAVLATSAGIILALFFFLSPHLKRPDHRRIDNEARALIEQTSSLSPTGLGVDLAPRISESHSMSAGDSHAWSASGQSSLVEPRATTDPVAPAIEFDTTTWPGQSVPTLKSKVNPRMGSREGSSHKGLTSRVNESLIKVVPSNFASHSSANTLSGTSKVRSLDSFSNKAASPVGDSVSSLFVNSIPYSEVFIDGINFGYTPVTAKLAAGTHSILLTRDGAVDVTKKVDVRAHTSRSVVFGYDEQSWLVNKEEKQEEYVR